MRKAISALLITAATSFAVTDGKAVENTWDNSVRASSSVQASPARITLSWPQDEKGANSYTVYRKAPGATSWGVGTQLSGSATSYVDSNITPGVAYEYRIVKVANGYTGYGYIQTGVNVPLVENRGKVVLLVDNTHASALSSELARLEQDLVGDGWTVLRHDVSRTASVASVKSIIKKEYDADPANVKSVFLFGRIPVPYSGQMAPDGHSDHRGAWPADAFYGDMDGNWTDSSVNYSQTENTNPAERARLSNKPGDGKFDQSTLPSAVELEVGRVDFNDMPGLLWTGGPTTLPSEVDLLRQYLNKDHKFRHREINPQRRAVVGDYFGWRNGEAFSSSAYGAFAAFFGADKTLNLNVAHNDKKGVWVPELASKDYLVAYGAGAGSYATIAGLGNGANYNNATTPEIVENNIKSVFTLVFGSWLGDWDSQDNFMRGILATKDYGLAAAWSGRPHWFIHPMGLGETIGYTTRLVQNNNGIYQNQIDSSARGTHIALMGDPTLRLHPVAPASNLTGSRSGSTASLSWKASADSVLGYHVYRATSAKGPFTRISNNLVTSTSFTDTSSPSGATYMVRAVKLETTPSGSYHNASQGIFWTASGGGSTTPTPADTTAPSVSITGPSGGSTVSGTSVTVSASASDNVGVVGVQFKLNNVNLGSEDITAPYSVNWNTTQTANGSATLTAVARDAAGNTKTSSVVTVNVNNGSSKPSPDPTVPGANESVWFDDALPAGASGYGSEAWNWVSSNPTPVSGGKAHQSALASGLHEHAFNWASQPMKVASGDILVTYVYLDPANPPTTLMLAWSDGSWEHRAYWGRNEINYGTNNTAGRYNAGALPATGKWVRLEVPAKAVGLEGKSVTGMSFSAFNGRVTWDKTGTSTAGSSVPAPTPEPETPAPVVDTTAPTVSLSAPANGSTVSGRVSVTANAADNIGVVGVRFKLNGADFGAEDTTPPYSVNWDTTTLANGRHSLAAVARDAAGNKTTSTNVSVTVSNSTSTPTPEEPAPTNPGSVVAWVDDALPAGASGYGSEPWTWVTSPKPVSGSKAHQSSLASGLHEHAFNWASAPLSVEVGDTLVTHVYLDPANPPTTLMLSWSDGSWEHRAYWGRNEINYGSNNTPGRYNAGALPATGKWVRLEVPAKAVGLEGKKVTGMSFSLFNGRATFDQTGKLGKATTPTPTPDPEPTPTPEVPVAVDTVWFDDALPAGGSGYGNEAWNWVSSNPTPVSGGKAHQSALASGLHEHAFNWASQPMKVASGATLFTYVYLDPANPPTTLMLAWSDGSWEHRAYWGRNEINYGTNNTAGRYNAGALPATGKWVRLEVPAKAVGLEGKKVTGMSFSLFNGRATFDQTGKLGKATTPTPTPDPTPPPEPTPEVPAAVDTVWFDDALPAGGSGYGNEAWNWVSSNPKPVSGGKAHQSALASGLHEHAFNWASSPMKVGTGNTLFTYVYLDPANPPTTLMLAWSDGSWEHRAYWGRNEINYGTNNTPGRYNAGALPATGRWVRLEVPAKAVGLEGKSVTGMSFSAFNGRVTWDKTGTSTAPSSGGSTSPNPSEPSEPAPTPTPDPEPTPNPTPTDPTNPTNPTDPDPSEPSEPSEPSDPSQLDENAAIAMPKVGDHSLTILAPNVLELERITTKQPDPATVSDWNFVNSSGVLTTPAASKFTVTVDGKSVGVSSVGFKRRVRYAPLDVRDLRIGNQLYLKLNTNVSEGQTVVVKNADGSLWPSTMTFTAKADALRYSPAIHVNQEGYVPSLPKKAMIGHYLGSLGELDVPASSGFKIVNATTGATVYTGTLKVRADVGYTYSPKPYQKVLEADFSSFKTPGEYQLVVPGVGASLPFLINDGVAMAFTRTYALGLYHQRSGVANVMPYTRHVRGAAHTAPAEVPSTLAGYEFTWKTIASKNADTASTNPPGVGKQLKDPASQLYPFVNTGKVDVSGGHFDAGDYSKYTINSAQLAHLLLFTADSISGAAALDNLGLPESGDGISDILQMAKHETDYIAKLQDADGGFYFIVYPKNREYESDVTPDKGDTQVVWPKNTSATAASVAALAQAASSPAFKAAYPQAAATYLTKAKLGWQFLTNAIAKHGKTGAYQKITFYGDNWIHDDELAWAAASLYAATGESQYHQKLMEWFPNPASPDTMRWSWWRMAESWGNAMRTYAFAARSGRLPANKLDSAYLAKCEEQIKLAGNDALKWSRDNAYGSAFPDATKGVMSAGWYFSLDQASDISVAYQLDPKADYIDALVGNMNYEAGTNPVNVTYVTGLGLKRQREVVAQYAKNDRRVLAPAGIPIGNIQSNFDYLTNYGASGNELTKLSFPSDEGRDAPYPFYDRWADTWNVTTEFITVNQARSLLSVVTLAAQTSAKSTPWKSATAQIVAPTKVVPLHEPVVLKLNTAGLDLTNARILWEGRDQEPDFGPTFAYTPKNTGEQWAEAEIVWPDGRRVVAATTFTANSPVVTWIDDALPAGAWTTGNESWNWTSANPGAQSGSKSHQSVISTGLTEHGFNDAADPLVIEKGDTLFAWVYLDPNNKPKQIMLHWNDGTWEHRAYWGSDNIQYGLDGTASRYRVGDLPPVGQWVKLEVPAKAVGLEGRSVKGMCFSVFGGRASWDNIGKASQEL